jgi:fused signal recognition particle receptor
MFGLYKKFKDGFSKTVSAIATKTRGLFGGRKIDASSLDELEEALYTADFGVETTDEILAEIKKAYGADKELRGQQAAEIGAAVLTRVLAGAEGELEPKTPAPAAAAVTPPAAAPASPGLFRRMFGGEAKSEPTPAAPISVPLPTPADGAKNPIVIAMIGVNGSGKTTTAAKLAWKLKQEGKSVTLAACDTFRAAAVEQLKTWAARLDLEVVASHTGADSAAVAFDAWQAAKSRGRDYLIVDTAGRLHTKSNLMEELAKIRRVLQKNDPTAPQHRWLVVDGSLGSNSIEQAKVFHQSFGLTGLVVTKLDGTSRGGALVGIYRQLKIPIYFLGLGEQAEDLQPFSVENYAKAVFGLDESA